MIRPAQSTRDEILTAVLQHLQKRLVGLDYFTLDCREEDSQNAGIDKAPNLTFDGFPFGDVGHGPDKLAITRRIL